MRFFTKIQYFKPSLLQYVNNEAPTAKHIELRTFIQNLRSSIKINDAKLLASKSQLILFMLDKCYRIEYIVKYVAYVTSIFFLDFVVEVKEGSNNLLLFFSHAGF